MKRVMVNLTDEEYNQLLKMRTWFNDDGFTMSDSEMFKYAFRKAYKNAAKVKDND